jgi:hypothetical protein
VVTQTNASKGLWVNDRLYFRRPFIYQPNAGLIDNVLDEYIPEFKTIRIE